jgi:hypothetical protein
MTPFAFRDLPADYFPLTMEFITESGQVVHRMDVPGPGAIRIPGLAAEHGPIIAHLSFANGVDQYVGPDGTILDMGDEA